MNRNRQLTLFAAALFILLVITVVVAARARNAPPTASQREPIMELGYCNSGEIKPCVDAFSQDLDNNLLVNIVIPRRTYPNFFLTIDRPGETNRYVCETVKGAPTVRTCIGKNMFPGEPLQFSLIALADNQVLAAGRFAIIGVMLFTPPVEPTRTPPSPAVTEDPFTTPTAFVLDLFTPLPGTQPSYPNPSYPNP